MYITLDPWRGHAPMILTESRSLAGVLRHIIVEYRARISSTNGQCGGFLRTEIEPKLRPGDRVIYLGDFDLSGGLIENNSVARPGCNSSHSLGSRRESCSAQQLPPIVSSGPLDAAVQELSRRHGEHEANTGSQKTGARAVVAEQHVPYAERQKVKQISPIGPLPQIRQRSPSQYP
jgi:hypothetical protein